MLLQHLNLASGDQQRLLLRYLVWSYFCTGRCNWLKVLSNVCCNASHLQRLNTHNADDVEIECICAECVFTFRLSDCRGVHQCSQTPPPLGFFRQVLDYDFNCVLNGSWPAEGLKIDIILIRPDCHALPLCGLIQMSRPHCSCTFMFPGSRHVRRAVQTHYSHWEPRTDFLQTSRVILVCKLSELNYQPLAVL